VSELPNGWRQVRLADVGTWYGGGTPSKSRSEFWADGSISWLSPKDMRADVLSATADHITQAAVNSSSTRLVEGPSVALVVRSGILERKLPIAEVPFDTTLNQDMKAVRPRDDVLPRYLRFAMQGVVAPQLPRLRKAGTTVASLDSRALLATEVPVAPIDEQHRIVAVLEDHLSRLDAAAAYVVASNKRLDRMLETARDAFAQGPGKPLCDFLAGPLRNGHSAPADPSGSVRTLTLTAVTAGAFLDTNTKMTSPDRRKVADLWLQAGDILVQRSNTPELVGTSALYDGPNDWAIFPDLLIRVRVDKDRLRPAYAAIVLASTASRRRFRSRARGLAGSMPKIDQETIATTPVPVPTLAEQDKAVREFDSIRASIARQRDAIAVMTPRGAALRRSVLSAAFAGRP